MPYSDYNIVSTIEFVLRHREDIILCVRMKRLDDEGQGHTGGGTTGHSRISDPTALKAIRAVEPIAFINCPFGPVINGRRDTHYVPLPEKWLLVEQATRKFYFQRDVGDGKEKIYKEIYRRRYLIMGGEPWQDTCRDLQISRGWYYAICHDIRRFAGTYAHGLGLLSASYLRRL